MTAPPAITHVGVTVTDLDRALRWYGDVLEFEQIGWPVEVQADEGHGGAVAADVFGDRFRRFRQAHLTSANGVAIELFEFLEPSTERRRENFEYWKTGVSHLCLATRGIERLAERIAETGGRQRTSRIWELFPGEPYRACYCEDPDGNIIELYSHSHERTYSNREG
ncbi:MAG: VOC family protein [Thermoleophilaceae bacterium]|nr:VOC family protein [Thermoleophilaceae bacterium]